jgi:hypothetical protein
MAATPTQIARFLNALWRFIGSGLDFLPRERILARFELCKSCVHFNGKWCRKCGCNCGGNRSYFNKLALPTEQCPVNRWPSEVQQSKKSD